jgi:hypothetical protein
MPTHTITDTILLGLLMGVMIGLVIDTAIQILVDNSLYGKTKFDRFITLTYFKCCAFLFRKKLVILRNWQGKVSLTLASKIDNHLVGYCYYRSRIHPITLYEDGTVQHLTIGISYMMNWLPYNLEERTFMILQGALGFEY